MFPTLKIEDSLSRFNGTAGSLNVLIIKNVATEGPGTIEDYLRSQNIPLAVADMGGGETPPKVDGFTHMVVMGGPMAVYEMDRHPHLKNEAKLIEKAIKADKHILGICLGAQMIAHVLGAKVYSGGLKEIGWSRVQITPEGMTDPVMKQLAPDRSGTAEVFQWHGDTFDLPAGAVRMASSDLFPNQAFRTSDRIYALQFHIEVTPVIVHDWFKDGKPEDLKQMDASSRLVYDSYQQRATGFYKEFFR